MPHLTSHAPWRWLLIAAVSGAASACNIGPSDHTRVDEATLSAADLERARTVQDYETSDAQGASGTCGQVDSVLAQLEVLGTGLLRFSGAGQMELQERIWARLPVAQRDALKRALAVQNRCATGAERGTALIIDIAGSSVIERYREQ